MNTTLGGMFSSRINMNLREEHGYTYGAQLAVRVLAQRRAFPVATGVRTDVTAPAVHEMINEVKRWRETGDRRGADAREGLAANSLPARSRPAPTP